MRVNLGELGWSSTKSENLIEVVASLDEGNISYEFNTLTVFKHTPTNTLFWAIDSGCSCPTPFESFWIDNETLDTNCEILHQGSYFNFSQQVENFPTTMSDRMKFKDKISALMWKPNDILKDIIYAK